MRNMTGRVLALTLLIALIFAPNSYAASYTTYGNVAGFTAAAGTTLSQNFNSYSFGQGMYGTDFITGVNVTSNELFIQVLGADKFLFASDPSFYDPRAYGTAYYQINLSSSYKAAGFDVMSWEIGGGSKALASEAGILKIFFADGTSASIDLYQTTDMAPVFFGVVADTAISYIQWYEPLEGDDNSTTKVRGNEETGLDNFIVGNPSTNPTTAPEPTTMLLLGLGLAGLAGARRFRK